MHLLSIGHTPTSLLFISSQWSHRHSVVTCQHYDLTQLCLLTGQAPPVLARPCVPFLPPCQRYSGLFCAGSCAEPPGGGTSDAPWRPCLLWRPFGLCRQGRGPFEIWGTGSTSWIQPNKWVSEWVSECVRRLEEEFWPEDAICLFTFPHFLFSLKNILFRFKLAWPGVAARGDIIRF